MNDSLQVGRLAMRQEGDYWVAYFARQETMNDAIPLASIKMVIVRRNLDRKMAFLNLMQEVVADAIEEETGVRPGWGGITIAPEHERVGNA